MAIILDASACICEESFNISKDFPKALTSRIAISRNRVRVSLVAYSQSIKILSRFRDQRNYHALENIVNSIFYEEAATGTAKTLQAINTEVVVRKSGSRIEEPGEYFCQ